MIASQAKLKKKSIDLTEGPILIKMISFVLPVMATNLLQTFYNAADMMVVSMSHEANAVGAIGMTGSFVGLIVNLFMGFSVGTNVLVARFLGAKDDKNVSKTVHTSIIMSIIVGFAATALGFFISRPILSMMGAQGNLLDLATTYTKIYFCGVPFLAATNYVAAIFRAKGDTKTPLYVLAISGIINVLFNLFFVLVVGLSVEGVAIATAISNLFAAIALIWLLSKDESPCRFSFSKCRIDRRAFVGIIREGLPAGIQSAVFSVSNMLIQSSIIQVNNSVVASMGATGKVEPVVNGNSAATNLEGFLYTAINSVYQAAITFTSQNYGAGKYKRIWRVILVSNLLAMFVGLIGTSIVHAFHDPLLALYGIKDGAVGSLEHVAYQAAVDRIIYVMSLYFTIGVMDASCGIVRGLGKTTISTVISLLGACVFRTFWVMFVFSANPTLKTVFISYPISWVLTGGAQLICAIYFLKKKIRQTSALPN